MFNRSEILLKAWASYRLARPAFFAKGDTADKRMFLGHLFAKMLVRAWDEAKKAARAVVDTAAAFVAAERRANATRIASMDPMARSARIVAIREEMLVLDVAPWGVRTGDRRAALGAELELLNSAAA